MAVALKFSKSEAAIPWGFRLVGGLDFDQPIVVVKVNEDSLAESAGLEVGDIIVRINDTSTAGLTHNEVHDLLSSAGVEFELGIRKGEITTRIISDEDYNIEESNAIRRAIEDEVIMEALNIVNNIKNSAAGISEQKITSIVENLSGQEEIINTSTLQTTTDVKRGKKWSTFLVKPDKPVPKSKKKEEEKVILQDEPYRVIIKKQSRRPSQEKKVQFDQNVTEVEVDFESEDAQEIIDINTKQSESVEIDVNVTETEEITIEEAEVENDYDYETNEEETEDHLERRDSVEMQRERLGSLIPEDNLEIKASLEEQLLAVQKQLKALAQLPSAIQLTLDAVSKQLATIVGIKESVEQNGDQSKNTSSSNDQQESPQTEEEFLDDTSLSEKAEAEVIREYSDGNSSIGEELEEDVAKELEEGEIEKVEEQEEIEEREPSPYAGLTEEEKQEQLRKEEHESKKQKRMDDRKLQPIQRPIILPGGRKWSNPEDAIPIFRKPKMSDDKIIETIESNLEVITGKTKGINFLKYQPPPKNLDYLQRSEVYRLVHDMEPPVRGIVTRAEKVPAVQDYYEATRETP